MQSSLVQYHLKENLKKEKKKFLQKMLEAKLQSIDDLKKKHFFRLIRRKADSDQKLSSDLQSCYKKENKIKKILNQGDKILCTVDTERLTSITFSI